jgi:predicted NBD/HSP70 family sugar kinase
LIGVGLSLPARVDPIRGTIVESQSFDLRNIAIRDLTSLSPSLPLLIENDANAVAWGAMSGAEGRGITTLLAVTARSVPAAASELSNSVAQVPTLRVGTGIVLNGAVYHGHDFGAGEFHSAAWTQESSGETSGHPWRAMTQQERNGRTGVDRTVVSDALGELLESLSVPVSMLRPQAIVYAGDLIQQRHALESLLRNELAGRFIDPTVSGIALQPARNGAFAGAVGAAMMFVERLFALPSVGQRRPDELPDWTTLQPGRVAWTA